MSQPAVIQPDRTHPAPLAAPLRARLRALLVLCLRHHRTRWELRDLSPHLLADIGLDEDRRRAECAKPFWRG
ncbi:DUF1127 domain-containing protein [Methylobacterium sp. WSM2598]|uniref:DUF1127 domain-containing protein n=1 Tax=Methylobacterium sp. WSM2598 TaxID=398261 RepID=UPI000381F6E3|nr:DUF1127 domain-containing protein [Methylobacterium sp. WSM2598]